MRLIKADRERVSSGDIKFLKLLLIKELESLTIELKVYKESKGRDDFLKGSISFLEDLLKTLESN